MTTNRRNNELLNREKMHLAYMKHFVNKRSTERMIRYILRKVTLRYAMVGAQSNAVHHGSTPCSTSVNHSVVKL